MSGFGFYETLRIFVPGVLAVVIVDLVARLLSGPVALGATGDLEALINAIETAPIYIGAALVAGLLLYLIDIPSKLRLHREGDPHNNFQLPSNYLAEALEGGNAPGRPLSIYFVLSDAYLPTELHRRVYLFGSLYRIYVDLRTLLALGVALGPAIWLLLFRYETITASLGMFTNAPSEVLTGFGIILLLLSFSVVLGLADTLDYLARPKRRGGKGGPLKRLIGALKEMSRICIVLPLLILGGGLLSATGHIVLGILGLAVTFVGFMLWMSVEVGPLDDQDPQATLRARVLAKLLPIRPERTHYPTPYRLVSDLSLIWPAGLLALFAGFQAGRSPTELLAWAVLIVPMSAILGFRKHEQRMLSVYADQVTWLRMHSKELENLAQEGTLGDGRLT